MSSFAALLKTDLKAAYETAAKPSEVAMVLRARGLPTEARFVESIAHLDRLLRFNLLAGVTDDRITEQRALLLNLPATDPRRRELERRIRGLKWANEALLRDTRSDVPTQSPTAAVLKQVNELSGEEPFK